MTECIFCKIINNEIPSFKIYEDEYTVVLDIAPILPGHVLVLPKKHVSSLDEADEVILEHTILVVQKIGRILQQTLNAKGYNLEVNNGVVAGQMIEHFHFHIIPRHRKEELVPWAPGQYTGNQAADLAKQLKAAL